MSNLAVFLPHEAVYPGLPSDFRTLRDLIRRMSRTDAVAWCMRVNLVLAHSGREEMHALQGALLTHLLPRERVALINQWAHRDGRQRGSVIVLFRTQMLELMSWIAILGSDKHHDGTTFNDPRQRDLFFRAALIVSDAWAERVFEGFESTTDRVRDRRMATKPFRLSLSASSAVPAKWRMLARAAAVYEHGYAGRYTDADQSMLEACGLTLEQYQCLSVFMLLMAIPDQKYASLGSLPIVDPIGMMSELRPNAREPFARYVAAIGQSLNQLAGALDRYDPHGKYRLSTPLDHLPLRRRPLIDLGRRRWVPADAILLAEKLTVGPLFELAHVNPKRQNEAFGAFGYGIESYVGKLLSAIFPNSPSLVDRLIVSPRAEGPDGDVEIADFACLLGHTTIALVESKAPFLRADSVQGEVEQYVSGFLAKYASQPDQDGSDRHQGATQLARHILDVALGHLRTELIDVAVGTMDTTVYPVLVVYDDLLNAPGHAELLARAFRLALAPNDDNELPTVRVGRIRVRPLVVLTVADLETLQGSLGDHELKALLDAYLADEKAHSFHDHLVAQPNLARDSMGDAIRPLVEGVLEKATGLVKHETALVLDES